MATVVVPFRSGGKSRLPADLRVDLALAMLGDVLEAAVMHCDDVRLVTDDAAAAAAARALGAGVIADPGGGQGAAVEAALLGAEAACLVVNADLPCLTPAALARLEELAPAHVPAADGTTNALALPDRTWFTPAYGAGSATRFTAAGLGAGHDPRAPARHRHARRSRAARVARPSARPANDACVESTQSARSADRVNIVLLSGGVGGAKLAAGLHDVLAPGELTIVGNVGDDLEVLGLSVSPDLDSVLYGLAGLNDTERGWGRAGETWQALESARAWGGEGWFMLGDLDIGLHLVRSQALREGEPLSVVTARLMAAAGLETQLLPATDDRLRTLLVTPEGTFAFQEWFVARRHEDPVDALVYDGAEQSSPAPGVLDAIAAADAIVIAPSNPFVSIHPILPVPGIRAALEARSVRPWPSAL